MCTLLKVDGKIKTVHGHPEHKVHYAFLPLCNISRTIGCVSQERALNQEEKKTLL